MKTESTSTAHGTTVEARGQSESFLAFQEALSRVAPIDRPVLIMGERGTGKELAASRLHFLSGRWQGPFVALNCATLNPSLIETELFGHEKGAFTGAQTRRSGRFQAADGGTLFLDEIGMIPMEAQEKILRAVEYGSFEPVGSSAPVEVDVRIIGATNADLKGMAQSGAFKSDLLDRLSFEVLFLPPLRKREGDIMLLAHHFAQRMAFELQRDDIPFFTESAEQALLSYSWWGNIRELKNVVERAVYRSDTDEIDHITFDPFQSPYTSDPSFKTEAKAPSPDNTNRFGDSDAHADTASGKGVSPPDFTDLPIKSAVTALEIFMLKTALDKARYNQKKAADLLGLTYDQFRGLRRKYKDRVE